MLKGKKETVLHTNIFEGKLSLMQETYSGVAGGEWILLGALEIEGRKTNGFTHNTFWLKSVLMCDAYCWEQVDKEH